MSLERRIEAVRRGKRVPWPKAVRSWTASAERFSAQAAQSGLAIDLSPKDIGELVRVCPVCGAQNGKLASECFNCQSALQGGGGSGASEAPKRFWLDAILSGIAARRFGRRFATKAALGSMRVPVAARFRVAPAARPAQSKATLDRFLELFVVRANRFLEVKAAPPPASEQSVLRRFLSVFVEKEDSGA